MVQNEYWGREELSNEITGRIDRILEEMRIEGLPVLEFPEQLLAVILIEIDSKSRANRWKENPFLYEGGRREAEWKLSQARERVRENPGFSKVLEGVLLSSSRQILMNLWELGKHLCTVYSGLELEFELTYGGKSEFQVQILAGVMDYLVDAVYRRENKEFLFTPYNLAVFMAELVAPKIGVVWDPAFGSGTLLIQAANRVKENYGTCQITGNEINRRMVRFAHINAFYHGMPLGSMEFNDIDTIEEFQKTGGTEKYDYILANPPVSSISDNRRKEFGFLAPTRKLHLQFLQVILGRLKEKGRAAVLVNENFLFSANRAEKVIREALVDHFGLRAVISLPQGAFAPYTYAKASILFLDRSLTYEYPVSFYELKALGYTLDKKGEPITENDIPKVLEAEEDREGRYREWARQIGANSQYNEQGIVVPSDWQYETGWFAKRESIREKDYSLMGTVYSMTRKELRKPEASPWELIERLQALEQESVDLLEKILEID
ncbi:MAG: SAM-dependent methyltransferase [Lachnospiraceae bacterium]|nr:SAM-dependent methyltransferase [Lachnospiraceae bacterium]